MQSAARKYSGGMTLMELMIVVVIASILVSIAVPSYMSQMRRGRRVEAKTAVLDLAGREERYFSTSATGANYSQTAADLGYTALPAALPSGYYTLSVCAVGPGMAGACPPSAQTAPGFAVTATPVAGTTQANDTQCASFSVDNTGRQWATDSAGNDNTVYCWGN
jgi:type IV pilus assembly protein PilE